MPKFFIKTYGCQMNERDSEQVAHSLIARGYERTDSEQEADVVLLNTCSVRDMADQKALGKMGMLGQLAKRRPEIVFGFLGCMAQARGASLLKSSAHRKQSGSSNSLPNRRPPSFRSCKAAICIARFASSRRRAAPNAVVPSRKLYAKFATSFRAA